MYTYISIHSIHILYIPYVLYSVTRDNSSVYENDTLEACSGRNYIFKWLLNTRNGWLESKWQTNSM